MIHGLLQYTMRTMEKEMKEMSCINLIKTTFFSVTYISELQVKITRLIIGSTAQEEISIQDIF